MSPDRGKRPGNQVAVKMEHRVLKRTFSFRYQDIVIP